MTMSRHEVCILSVSLCFWDLWNLHRMFKFLKLFIRSCTFGEMLQIAKCHCAKCCGVMSAGSQATWHKVTRWWRHCTMLGKVFCFLCMYVCMYVCMSKDLYPACLKQSHRCATVSNKQKCLQCRLNRPVDRSTERKEVRRLFQIVDSATAKLQSRNILLVCGTTNVAVTDDRSVRRLESAMS